MCGFACIAATNAARFTPHLERMVRSLAHRGPDASGIHAYGNCILGHARLSVVDIAGSPQPMLSPDGRTAVAFNGEIYGFREIKAAFSGYDFRTRGDTELLLAMHARDGDAMPGNLPGMFAYAIWDDRSQTLHCARDRFGEKPLYYALAPGGALLVASEIKAILASGLISPTLAPDALAAFLQRGFLPPHRTIYRGIETLPPAHRAVFRNGTATVSRYWRIPEDTCPISPSDAAEQFRALFGRAVARQLEADVPVGAFLSGGLDSSTIVAEAASRHPGIKTFSFGMGGGISELPYARAIATRYATDHMEVEDASVDLAAMLARMQYIFDEPHADTANIPTFLIAKLAREHVTVALAGEGGDELLGGYAFWYRPLFSMERAARWPKPAIAVIHLAGGLCRRLGIPFPRSLASLREGDYLRVAHADPLAGHYARNGYFGPATLRALGLEPQDPVPPAVRDLRDRSISGVMRADLLDYLPGDILVKTDRASMANSLEIRAPFLDVDLATFCITLPASLKLTHSTDKAVLRRAYAEAWTPAIRKRSKQGFGAPVADWLARPDLRDRVRAIAENPAHPLFELLDRRAALPLLGAHDMHAWILLNLALWLETRHP